MTRLYDLAKVLRSKNSGPFEITLDVLFDNRDVYEHVKRSGAINKKSISKMYNVEEDMISSITFFDQAMGIKVTLPRKISSGTCGDRDVYGAQQHAPLMELLID